MSSNILIRGKLRVAAAFALVSSAASAQSLDSLVARAIAASPTVRAAEARIASAQARVGPAGIRPDPMLMAGIQNMPAFSPGFGDEMTMKMVGVSQMIPLGGKLRVARSVAEAEVTVATETRRAALLDVERNVRLAAFDIGYVDRALTVVERNRVTLGDIISAAEIRFGTGTASGGGGGMGSGPASSGLADILRARAEAAKLGEQAAMLHEQRRAAIAAINAMLGRPSADSVSGAGIPASLERVAVAPDASAVRFESAVLGSRAAGSPLLSVDSLQKLARANSAEIRVPAAMIAVQALRAELATRERRPDIEASVQYGQRDGMPDMLTATVSIPLQLRRKDRQDQMVTAERSELAAIEADRAAAINRVNAEIARLHAMAERARTQLALYKTAMIPQAQLGVEAATVAFRSGTESLRAVLDAQTMVFNSEIAYHLALLDFARAIAELQQVVGTEVLHD
jgi:outer membrane protein TolC